MSIVPLLVALFPLILIFLLLTLRRTAADVAGLLGWITTALVAWLWFKTPIPVVLIASLSGLVASLPVSLVTATSIFQITLMSETGAVARVVALIKTIAPRDPIVQIFLVNVGVGTLLGSLGSTAISILPPILIALGFTPFLAIILPAIGYNALCSYGLFGTPVVVFSNFVNLPVTEVGGYFARYVPVISFFVSIGILWIVGKWKLVRKGIVPTILISITQGAIALGMNEIGLVTLTGVAGGLGVILVLLAYLKITGRKVIDMGVLSEADRLSIKRMSIFAAASPWIILTILSLLVNIPSLPFYNIVFKQLELPLEIIPGSPEKLRLFWQAYFWIFISIWMAFPFLRVTKLQLKNSITNWLRRAPRPIFAAAIYFAIAYVINHSGKNMDWQLIDPGQNMVQVMSSAAVAGFGKFYPVIAPYLGLLGGFISGSEASSIAMLTKTHLTVAEQIGAIGLLVAAASGFGGGLASVISPAKLQNAAASIDRIGDESKVMPTAFVVSMVVTAVAAIMTMIWAY